MAAEAVGPNVPKYWWGWLQAVLGLSVSTNQSWESIPLSNHIRLITKPVIGPVHNTHPWSPDTTQCHLLLLPLPDLWTRSLTFLRHLSVAQLSRNTDFTQSCHGKKSNSWKVGSWYRSLNRRKFTVAVGYRMSTVRRSTERDEQICTTH